MNADTAAQMKLLALACFLLGLASMASVYVPERAATSIWLAVMLIALGIVTVSLAAGVER